MFAAFCIVCVWVVIINKKLYSPANRQQNGEKKQLRNTAKAN